MISQVMEPPCFHLGETVFGVGNFFFFFRSANHPEATNISSPAILISPINQPVSEEKQVDGQQTEGEEKERKICVDGDDVEFTDPLMVTYLRLQLHFSLNT